MLERRVLQLPGWCLRRLAGGPPIAIGGRILDPAVQLVQAAAAHGPHLASLPVPRARAAADRGMARLAGPRRRLRVEDSSLPGPGGAIPVRLYRPQHAAMPAPLLLWFHPGGFVLGNLEWCDALCRVLSDTARCLVLSVDYRRAPEHRFPAQVEDARAVWLWAEKRADEVGGDPARLALGGESAGGTLALAIAREARRAGGRRPVFQLLVYPWLLGRADTPSYAAFANTHPLDARLLDWFRTHALERPEDVEHPLLNPGREPDVSGLPPTYLATAGFDMLCDEGRLYADRLRSAGVPTRYRCFESLPHTFAAMGAIPAAARAQREIAEALRGGLARA